MRTFAIPKRIEDEEYAEKEIRTFVRDWVDLLAERKYAEAVELLFPQIPQGSGSVDSSKAPTWTPLLLESLIANYGTPEPIHDVPPLQSEPFVVVPLGPTLTEAFEASVSVDFDRAAISALAATLNTNGSQQDNRGDWLSATLSLLRERGSRAKAKKKMWLGGVEFSLPLNLERGNDLSDLTARMRFKPVGSDEMLLVLLDIHVL